jgi:hypothetical protein
MSSEEEPTITSTSPGSTTSCIARS